MSLSPDSYQKAVDALREGSLQDGMRLLSLAINNGKVPGHSLPEAYSNLGTALSMLGRASDASHHFLVSLHLNPRVALVHYNYGASMAQTGRKNEAIASYERALSLAPSMDMAYNNLGNLLVDVQRAHEAAASYRGALLANPQHALAYNNLGNVVKDSSEAGNRLAGLAYCMAIRLSPMYTEAYRNLANLLKEKSAWHEAAVAAYRITLRLSPNHRMTLLNMGETLSWLGMTAAADLTHNLAVERGVWMLPHQRPSHFVPGLRAKPWWPISTFSWSRRLLAGYSTLLEEGLALMEAAGFDQYRSPALQRGVWKDVTLTLSGSRQPGAARAPRSYALLKSLGEDVLSMVSGSAYFSILEPGSSLRAHCGPTNVRLRLHVGLSVPSGAGMRVAEETRAWKEGAALLFDDSFEHEVWNNGSYPRLVFIVDAWHPDLDNAQKREAALDPELRERFARALGDIRHGDGLADAPDLLAGRRTKVMF